MVYLTWLLILDYPTLVLSFKFIKSFLLRSVLSNCRETFQLQTIQHITFQFLSFQVDPNILSGPWIPIFLTGPWIPFFWAVHGALYFWSVRGSLYNIGYISNRSMDPFILTGPWISIFSPVRGSLYSCRSGDPNTLTGPWIPLFLIKMIYFWKNNREYF